MSKKIIILVVIIGVIAVAAIIALNATKSTPEIGNTTGSAQNNNVAEVVPITPENKESAVKEFVMDSFYEIVDGQSRPQYSLKEITVNQGDLVRVKITVTKGIHDFKIDEYNVYADTQLDQPMTIEFIADKAGEFIYYCTKPGHRANGQWGTLKVLAQ